MFEELENLSMQSLIASDVISGKKKKAINFVPNTQVEELASYPFCFLSLSIILIKFKKMDS